MCAGIHMSDVPSFPYELLWGERCCAPWRTSPGETVRSSSPSRRASRFGPKSKPFRSSTRTRPSTGSAQAMSAARPCSFPRSARARRGCRARPHGRPGVSCARSRTRSRGAPRARRRLAWQSSPRPTSTCADSAGKPDVIVQTCRSWTSTTPGARARRSPTTRVSIPLGAASSKIVVESRKIDHELASTRTPMNTLTSGSASSQPVARMTTAAATTPAEPRRSAKTCR